MSHSPDFASWRWTNCARCSSADVENSSSLTVTPLSCSLNSLSQLDVAGRVLAHADGDVALGAFSIDAGSMAFAPSVVPVSLGAAAAAAAAVLVVVAAGGDTAHERGACQQRRKSRLHLTCTTLLRVVVTASCGLLYPSPALAQPRGGAVEPRSHDCVGPAAMLSTSSPAMRRSSSCGAQRAALLERLGDGRQPGRSARPRRRRSRSPTVARARARRRPGRLQHADRLHVGGGEDRGRRRRAAPAARRPRRAPPRAVAARRTIRSGASGRRPRRARPRSPAAAGAGVEAEQVLLLVADEGDPAVPELEQVLRREPAARDVVDR